MKVRTAVKRICPSCKLVRRGRKQFVICGANARHKQRQGFSTLAAGTVSSPVFAQPMSVPQLREAVLALQSLDFGEDDEDL